MKPPASPNSDGAGESAPRSTRIRPAASATGGGNVSSGPGGTGGGAAQPAHTSAATHIRFPAPTKGEQSKPGAAPSPPNNRATGSGQALRPRSGRALRRAQDRQKFAPF